MLINSWKNKDGNALLIVVVLMSVLFMLSTIVFGFVIRQYNYGQDQANAYLGGLQQETGLSDVITELCRRLDEDESIGDLTISDDDLHGDTSLSYSAQVYEDSESFSKTSNLVTYTFARDTSEDGLIDLLEGAYDTYIELARASSEESEIEAYLEEAIKVLYAIDIIENGEVTQADTPDETEIALRQGQYDQQLSQAVSKVNNPGNSLHAHLATAESRLVDMVEAGYEIPEGDLYEMDYDLRLEDVAVDLMTQYDNYHKNQQYMITIHSDNPDTYTVEVYRAY